jgi:hypothetical protein
MTHSLGILIPQPSPRPSPKKPAKCPVEDESWMRTLWDSKGLVASVPSFLPCHQSGKWVLHPWLEWMQVERHQGCSVEFLQDRNSLTHLWIQLVNRQDTIVVFNVFLGTVLLITFLWIWEFHLNFQIIDVKLYYIVIYLKKKKLSSLNSRLPRA